MNECFRGFQLTEATPRPQSHEWDGPCSKELTVQETEVKRGKQAWRLLPGAEARKMQVKSQEPLERPEAAESSWKL